MPVPATSTRPALTRVPTAEERRRAQRVLLRMPVLLHVANRPKPLEAQTHTVSQNGAMLVVTEGLPEGAKFSLENPRIEKRVDARVVRAAQAGPGGLLMPVEFTSPAPTFWGIFFPPAAT
jgi:PilZ domain